MSWFAYFITIISVIISLKLSCYVGRKLGLNMVTEEIALVPFRYLLKEKGDGNDGEPDARRKLEFEKKAKIGWN